MRRLKVILGKCLYYLIGIHLPMSYSKISFRSRQFRQLCVKMILGKRCGKWINFEKNVHFGDGLTIGNGSGIGANSIIPSDVIIGESVMMGRDIIMHTTNHKYDRLDLPMGAQGNTESKTILIGNDVWIGDRVIILPGVKIGCGCVIGAGAVVTRDIPDFEVWGGVPARFIKSRLHE